jgi:hypothetical protein
MARIPIVAVISVLLLLPACSRDAEEAPVVPPAPSPQDPRSRELAIPKLEDGQPCPRTKGKVISPAFAPAIGVGPAYPVGLGTQGVLDELEPPERFESKEWGGQKVLWVVDPRYDGPILIRGRQLDGPNDVRFGDRPQPSKQMHLAAGPVENMEGGFRNFPSYTRLRAPGCYAYQVDGSDFSLIIVFEAKRIS